MVAWYLASVYLSTTDSWEPPTFMIYFYNDDSTKFASALLFITFPSSLELNGKKMLGESRTIRFWKNLSIKRTFPGFPRNGRAFEIFPDLEWVHSLYLQYLFYNILYGILYTKWDFHGRESSFLSLCTISPTTSQVLRWCEVSMNSYIQPRSDCDSLIILCEHRTSRCVLKSLVICAIWWLVLGLGAHVD